MCIKMEAIRRLHELLTHFFAQYYPLITIISAFIFLVHTYLHYELSVNKNDSNCWKQIIELLTRDLDYYHVVLLTGVVLINLSFLIIILLIYMRPINDSNDMTLLEIKDRYVRFIMLRMIARLDKIQTKLSMRCSQRQRKEQIVNKELKDKVSGQTGGGSNHMRCYMRAHEHMAKAVATFRKDVRKVIAPSETEIMLPIEDVFSVAEEEERALKRAGYYKLPIQFTDEVMKSLLNPTTAMTTIARFPLSIYAEERRQRN